MLYLDWPTLQTVIVLVLVIVVFVGFVRETMPPDIVALVAVGLLLVTGILGTDEMLSVFSNSAPITVAAMFVLSAALERTGVIDRSDAHTSELQSLMRNSYAVFCLKHTTI